MRGIWLGLAGCVSLAGGAGAQGLPATAPTQPTAAQQQPQNQLSARPTAALPVAPAAPQHRAQVRYAGRTLEVTADNSSLNQILREVGRVTGMKISGGVTDERVYGTYGPGDVSAVLAQLLGGTGSNMLLILDSRDQPSQLLLTPRQGGPTPPGPGNSALDGRRDDDDDLPPQLTPHVQRPAPPVQPPPAQVPEAQTVAPAVTDTPAASAAATTTEESPNGVKTPQQIYDQLMKLQQQKVKTPNPQ